MKTTSESPASDLLDRLGGLHDPSRLRLLSLLDSHELSVGELAAAIQSPQSTVSRHLKRLLASGWISRRSVGPQALYRRAGLENAPRMRDLWNIASAALQDDPAHKEDLRRVAEVLSQRRMDSHAFFDTVADDWASMRKRLFGHTIELGWLPALLEPDAVVADLGCGTGSLAAMIAPWVARIEAVDRESAMLDAARTRLMNADNVVFHQADVLQLPITPGTVDIAILSLILHHTPSPEEVTAAATKMLRPGGRLLIVDMIQHDRAEYRDTMGHLHLGFDTDDVRIWMHQAGLTDTRALPLRPDPDAIGPGLFAATGRILAID